jgi:hypothetical protein
MKEGLKHRNGVTTQELNSRHHIAHVWWSSHGPEFGVILPLQPTHRLPHQIPARERHPPKDRGLKLPSPPRNESASVRVKVRSLCE